MSKKNSSKSSGKIPDSIELNVRKKCYSGIDEMPIWNWFELFKQNNFKLIIRNGKLPPKKQIPILKKIYTEFYDQYLDEFGLNETSQEIRELRHRYITNINNVLQGDMGAQTFVDIDKSELKEYYNKINEKQSIWELKSRMEVALKINIDVKKCSVIEFYSYLKLISEINQQ